MMDIDHESQWLKNETVVKINDFSIISDVFPQNLL